MGSREILYSMKTLKIEDIREGPKNNIDDNSFWVLENFRHFLT